MLRIKTKYNIGQKIYYISINYELYDLEIKDCCINQITIEEDKTIYYFSRIDKTRAIYSTKEELFNTYKDAEIVVNKIKGIINEKYNSLENLLNTKDMVVVERIEIIENLIKEENKKLYNLQKNK